MNTLTYSISKKLLEIEAVKFNFEEPFVWTSGLKSPVYCDIRKSLFHYNLRTQICDAYVEVIKDKFHEVEVIAGVATGAISQGALISDKLKLPFVYVREGHKSHGMKNVIEGGIIQSNQKVVIIEDTISTGGSCLKAFENLKKEDVDVLGVVAAFSYGFSTELDKLVKIETISTFPVILDVALKEKYITGEEFGKVDEWYKNLKF